jgi:hypothetical protein
MSVKPKIIRLSRHGRALGTRALGEKVADEIGSTGRRSAALIVDFSDVRVASSPFLDEVAVAMHAAIAAQRPPFVLLAGMNADVMDTMTLVLERRNMALGAVEDEQLEVLGGGPRLQETLEAAQKLGTFTAAELAEQLAQKVPNLHQRLSQLQDAGVLNSEDDPTARRGRRLQFKTAAVELDPASC